MDRPAAPAPVRRARLRRTLALAALVLPLTACGLRLETPPPAEPSPDAVEQVRGRTVADALDLAADAEGLAATTPEGPAREVLEDVVAHAARHAAEAGGVYDSGLPRPTPSTTPTPRPAPDAGTLLVTLVEDAATASADADAVPDGPLARLVASVATSRADLARRLSTATGLPLPAVDEDRDEPSGSGASAGASPAPSPDATPATATGAHADALAAVALAHDEAGYAYEVLAARRSGDAREDARAAAARHRAAGARWAAAAGVVGRSDDPRRSAYALPAALDDPVVLEDLARRVESAVTDAYATAVATAPAGGRASLVAGLRASHDAATARGAAPVAFPGLPELAGEPVG
ncbi:DUF4439 domain-containing protein [Cellulomonas sp. JZ18]|uniref:DUF4439 domain-containing protein n=1 Tax=Cellulomonas sp. JZ18 TaxID=2654191 RepID=UPI0012D4B7EB|nr:DUF4439 domain-containing protein [Cellulomonas sp. JZ18]QGQ19657.1 DUF4439 domain-containing protein [Cellulomonas sp. JZ18]